MYVERGWDTQNKCLMKCVLVLFCSLSIGHMQGLREIERMETVRLEVKSLSVKGDVFSQRQKSHATPLKKTKVEPFVY